jgi:CopG-like RHH_1 or ribbon-helix-helix domain, RHH_5
MDTTPTISVTLSADLLNHLRRRARSERVSLSWLVAGLVCDTVAAWKDTPPAPVDDRALHVGG